DRRQYWKDTEIVIDNILRSLSDKNKLTECYRKAAAQRLFLVARNVYDIDKVWNKNIIRKVYSLDVNFEPINVSKKFTILFKLFNYKIAEKIAHLKFMNLF